MIRSESVDGLASTGPGHPQAQWKSNSYAWHTNYSVHQGTYGMLRSSQNNIQLGDQHQIWGWPGTYWAKTSTDTVKIKFTYKKYELKWISKYCVYCNLDETNAGEELSVCEWLGRLGARPSTGTINTIIICVKYENTMIIWAYVETKTLIKQNPAGCAAPCLRKAWHLTGPGHPLAQSRLIS